MRSRANQSERAGYFSLVLCALIVPACSAGKAPTDCVGRSCEQDADSGSDADTDGDTSTDTDTASESYVECQGLPAECDQIGETLEQQSFGCCLDGSVYWCEDGQLVSIDCEADGTECGYDDVAGFMDCV